MSKEHLGVCRFAFNCGFEKNTEACRQPLNVILCCVLINIMKQHKDAHHWLKNVNSWFIQPTPKNLDKVYMELLRDENDFHKFKSIHNHKQSSQWLQHRRGMNCWNQNLL